jgi:hypothetical protein
MPLITKGLRLRWVLAQNTNLQPGFLYSVDPTRVSRISSRAQPLPGHRASAATSFQASTCILLQRMTVPRHSLQQQHTSLPPLFLLFPPNASLHGLEETCMTDRFTAHGACALGYVSRLKDPPADQV